MKQTGAECLLKIGADTVGLMLNTEMLINNVVVDITARSSGQWTEILSGIRGWTIRGRILYNKGDAGMDAMRNALLNGTKLVDAKFIYKGGEGFKGDAYVKVFGQNQPFRDGVKIPVVLQGTGAPLYQDPVT